MIFEGLCNRGGKAVRRRAAESRGGGKAVRRRAAESPGRQGRIRDAAESHVWKVSLFSHAVQLACLHAGVGWGCCQMM